MACIRLNHDRRQIVGPLFVQQIRLDDGAWGHDACHLAGHQTSICDLPHLLGNSDAIALLDESGDVPFNGVVGNTGHRDTLILGHRTRGQHQVKFTSGDLSILVEGFVEITQPEEDDSVWMLRLNLEVLPTEWGQFGHRYIVERMIGIRGVTSSCRAGPLPAGRIKLAGSREP
jgi:hypothetical protein